MNRDAPVDLHETKAEKKKRIAALEADHEAWFKYYFPKYYTSEPTAFHKRSTKRIMDNPEYYEVRAWSRELAKSGRTMMEAIKLALTGKKRNIIIVSAAEKYAIKLLAPYKAILEKSARIINDYGEQKGHKPWTESYLVSRKGFCFLAIGKGQTPRGTRNEEVRPDMIIPDDFDTDEDCRNPDTIDKYWEWFERALYATRSISNPLLVVFCGNIIAEDCTIKRAMKKADHSEVINIRMPKKQKDGSYKMLSAWPEKNTEAMIDRALSKISYVSQQGEYFNNPITLGKVFTVLHYKNIQPLRNYQFLVAYTDPSYKSGKKNDFKATALIGKWRDEYHVIKVYCAQTTTSEMLKWQYQILKMVEGKVPVYFIIEWPSIDDTLKLEIEKENKAQDLTLPLKADERDKGDKFHRIESLLEPLNRNEKLWFNKQLKDSQHMEHMENQFLALSKTSSAHDDGPDAVEGGVFFINSKTINDTSKIVVNKNRSRNPKRW